MYYRELASSLCGNSFYYGYSVRYFYAGAFLKP